MKKLHLFASTSLAFLFFAGCGGGGTSVTLPANTAVIFSASDTSGNLTSAGTAIRGIQVTATLPPGVFPNISSGRFLRIGETGLKSLKGNGIIPFGRYSATTNQVVFAVLANPIDSSIGFGDFARLTYNANPGVSVSETDFQQGSYKVSGPGSSDLSSQVTRGVKLTTYTKP